MLLVDDPIPFLEGLDAHQSNGLFEVGSNYPTPVSKKEKKLTILGQGNPTKNDK